jgi:cell fate regulator YaaT (PSP1 superfamily)
MKKKDEASTKSHGGTKQDSRAYEVLWHEHQMEKKALTRIPMEGRLYHIKYETLIKK